MSYLAIDIGGTFIKYALFDAFGRQLNETQRVKTKLTDTKNFILDQVLEICEECQLKEQIEGIAVATAGVVDSQKGSIAYAGYTIPNYTGTPLKKDIELHTGVKCTVINDVNAAALGEYWKGFVGELKPYSLICLTIGTGVGGAILIDGKLYEGIGFTAGEVGYMPINGQYFQDLASTTALLSNAEKRLGYHLNGEEFFEYLKNHSSNEITDVFDEFIDALAQGILTIQYLLNPECIVIGGGIMAQEQLIIPALKDRLKQIAVSERFITADIKAAQLGNNAGMLGALYRYFQENK